MVGSDHISSSNYLTAGLSRSEAITTPEQREKTQDRHEQQGHNARLETSPQEPGDRAPLSAIRSMTQVGGETAANAEVHQMLAGVTIGGGAESLRAGSASPTMGEVEASMMGRADAQSGSLGGARQEATSLSPNAGDAVQPIADAGDKVALGNDRSNALSKLEMPTPEQLRTMPISEIQEAVRKNREILTSTIQDHYAELPQLVGAHGGTRESNDIFVSSGGSRMVPDAATSGNMEDTVWVGASPKSSDPAQYAADLARDVKTAARYANPSWVAGDFTPGGVAVMDLSRELDSKSRARFYEGNEDSNGMQVKEEEIPGIGTSRNSRSAYLHSPEKCFADGFKGIIDVAKLDQYEPLTSELWQDKQYERYEGVNSIAMQNMAAEALKLLLPKE